MSVFKKWILFFAFFFSFTVNNQANAEPMKEFIKACTYGVLAGTMIGIATLAFAKKPGDNLQNIARGASLGLYAGILLGTYVVYYVPQQQLQLQEENVLDQISYKIHPLKPPLVTFFPILSEQNSSIKGFGANFQVYSF